MNDIVTVAVLERTANLTCKLFRNAFPQSSMTNDIIEHLSSAHILKDHVIVACMYDEFTHAADVRVIEEH